MKKSQLKYFQVRRKANKGIYVHKIVESTKKENQVNVSFGRVKVRMDQEMQFKRHKHIQASVLFQRAYVTSNIKIPLKQKNGVVDIFGCEKGR